MDYRALEAFAAVVALGSITGAARSLGRSQPAVSRLVQELEQALGCQLLERNGPRIAPSARGRLLAADVERALSAVRVLRQRAETMADAEVRPLRVCSISSLALGLLPQAWRRFSDGRPTRLQLATVQPDEARFLASENMADLALTSLPFDQRQVSIHWLGSAPCVISLPQDHALAGHAGPISLSHLRHERFVTMTAGMPGLTSRIARHLDEAGISPHRLVETSTTMSALAFVRAGAGIAITEPVTIAGIGVDGIVTRPLAGDIRFHFGAISPERAGDDVEASALAAAVLTQAEALLPEFRRHAPGDHTALLHESSLSRTLS